MKRELSDDYRVLFEANPQPMWVYDRESLAFLAVNDAAIALYGHSREEFLSMTLRDVRPAEDVPALEALIAGLGDGVSRSDTRRHITKDGQRIEVSVSSHPIDLGGRPARLALITDVTERERTAEALAERETLLRAIVDSEPECVKVVAPDGSIIDMNPAGLAMMEADDLERVKGKSIYAIVAEADREAFRELTESAVRGESGTLEFEIVGLKGTHRRLETHAVPLRNASGEIVAALGLTRDVTGRRMAEEATRRAASLLQATLDSTEDGILVVDLEGKIRAFNSRFAELWRIPKHVLDTGDDDQAIAHVLEQLKDPDAFVAKVRALYQDRGAESFDVLEFKDGRIFERYSAPQVLEGEAVGRVWSFRDVTQRTRAERELRAAEERYRSLLERLPAVVYVAMYGEGTPWFYVSPRIESMLGFTPEEWMDEPALWLQQLHPDDRDRVMAEENASRDNGTPLFSEYRILARDGRVVWVRDEAEVVRDDDDRPLALRGLWYDITAQKEAEVALRSSEQLIHRLFERLVNAQEEERARIAQDIHDDSIQVVTAVELRLQTLRRALDDPSAIEQLEKLQATVRSAIARLRNLLFELRPRALDEEGLASALRLYLDHMQTQADIETHLTNRLVDEPGPNVRTILYRIAQEALVNVRRHANATKVELLLEPREAGFYLRVKDNGDGFGGEVSDRSEPGHLGLSSMRERAEMAQGWVRVEGTPGRGTIVESWVPASA